MKKTGVIPEEIPGGIDLEGFLEIPGRVLEEFMKKWMK